MTAKESDDRAHISEKSDILWWKMTLTSEELTDLGFKLSRCLHSHVRHTNKLYLWLKGRGKQSIKASEWALYGIFPSSRRPSWIFIFPHWFRLRTFYMLFLGQNKNALLYFRFCSNLFRVKLKSSAPDDQYTVLSIIVILFFKPW